MTLRALIWRFRIPAVLAAFVSLLVITAAISSCQQRGGDAGLGQPEPPRPTGGRGPARPWALSDDPTRPGPGTGQPGPYGQPTAPRLDREPQINVLLETSTRLVVTLLRSAEAVAGNQRTVLPPGPCLVEYSPAGLRVPGFSGPVAEAVLTASSGPGQESFRVIATPPIGKPQVLTCGGIAVLHADHVSRRVQLIERLPMEDYLAGVLPVEMIPTWPVEALAAQAIAARSYAAARWMERHQQAWQVHWHFSVDMAYGGMRRRSANVQAALERSRGTLLLYQGRPVLALFHAASGGATESAAHLFPALGAAVAVMPTVVDPAAEAGATGLNYLPTHWRWSATVPLADITRGLQEWSREKPSERPRFGTVVSLHPASRWPDSGRVAQVSIRHRQGIREAETLIAANDFRIAVGPGLVRSTWWDRCVMATSKGQPVLVVAGRGYGHGVGLAQVSAWELAREGLRAEEIVARFYPGAAVERRW